MDGLCQILQGRLGDVRRLPPEDERERLVEMSAEFLRLLSEMLEDMMRLGVEGAWLDPDTLPVELGVPVPVHAAGGRGCDRSQSPHRLLRDAVAEPMPLPLAVLGSSVRSAPPAMVVDAVGDTIAMAMTSDSGSSMATTTTSSMPATTTSMMATTTGSLFHSVEGKMPALLWRKGAHQLKKKPLRYPYRTLIFGYMDP